MVWIGPKKRGKQREDPASSESGKACKCVGGLAGVVSLSSRHSAAVAVVDPPGDAGCSDCTVGVQDCRELPAAVQVCSELAVVGEDGMDAAAVDLAAVAEASQPVDTGAGHEAATETAAAAEAQAVAAAEAEAAAAAEAQAAAAAKADTEAAAEAGHAADPEVNADFVDPGTRQEGGGIIRAYVCYAVSRACADRAFLFAEALGTRKSPRNANPERTSSL
jgi:hypothetical protein